MAPATQNRKKDVVRDFRRVVIRADLPVAGLIDLVANYLFCNKSDVTNAVWRAGLIAHFGLSAEEVDDGAFVARPLPRGTQPPEEIQDLVRELLR